MGGFTPTDAVTVHPARQTKAIWLVFDEDELIAIWKRKTVALLRMEVEVGPTT